MTTNNKYFIVSTEYNGMIVYKLNDNSNAIQLAHFEQSIGPIYSFENFIVCPHLESKFSIPLLLTFKINEC